MQNDLSRRDLLKGVGAGALALSLSQIIPYIKAQEDDNNLMNISINGVDIHYQIRGEGIPVLFLHGFPLDHGVMMGAFEPIFENRTGYQRIYPDLVGMGLSPANDSIASSDDMLRVMTEFVTEVTSDQPFIVVGFSYGGYLAQGMVYQNPDMLEGVMLMAPQLNPNGADRNLPESVPIVIDPEATAMLPEGAAPVVLSTIVVQTKPVIGRVIDEYANAFSRGDQEYLINLRRSPGYQLSFDVLESDAIFEKPALILTGRHDSIVGYAEAFDVSKQYSRATYAALDRAGHGVYLEQDAIFQLMVNEWLDRVEESMNM